MIDEKKLVEFKDKIEASRFDEHSGEWCYKIFVPLFDTVKELWKDNADLRAYNVGWRETVNNLKVAYAASRDAELRSLRNNEQIVYENRRLKEVAQAAEQVEAWWVKGDALKGAPVEIFNLRQALAALKGVP